MRMVKGIIKGSLAIKGFSPEGCVFVRLLVKEKRGRKSVDEVGRTAI